MRAAATLARSVVGGYLAVHGAQKLFGAFGGHGLDATGKGFASIGLTPGRELAFLAGASELGGGLLMATGVAEPLGPLTVAATMAVAATTHRKAGPLAANGGYELAATDLAFAVLAASASTAGYRIGPRLPNRIATAVAIGSAGTAALVVGRLLRAARQPVLAGADADTPETADAG